MGKSGGKTCCVPLCHNYWAKCPPGTEWFSFPRDEKYQKIWLTKIRRDTGNQFQVTKNTRICSHHFVPFDKFPRNALSKVSRLKPTAIPSIFPWRPSKNEVGKTMQEGNNVGKMNLRVSICKTCVDFKRKSDCYAQKCENYEWKFAELEVQISEKDKLLKEYKKQIEELEERLRCKANRDEKIGIDEVMDGCGQWDVVVPKIELPDASEDLSDDSYSPLTKDVETRMEPEVVLEEGEDDDSRDEENDSSPPTTKDHRKANKRTTNTNLHQTFYQICRWTTKDTNGTTKACLKVHSVCELTTHISRYHVHWNNSATHKCFWENCGDDTEFKSRNDLIKHVACHLLQAKYRCDVENCGEEFIHESHLERHMFSHRCKRTLDRRFKCPYDNCDRTFANTMNLRHHIATHTKEKVRVPNAANVTQDTVYKAMPICSVKGCMSTTESGNVSLHYFPRDEELRKEWRVRLKLDKSLGTPRICHKHFLPTDFFKYDMQSYGDRRRLKIGVVPSQCLPV